MEPLSNLTVEERVLVVFAKRKKRQFAFLIPALAAVVLAIVVQVVPDFRLGPVTQDGSTFILLGVVVLYMVFMRFNWRCPMCGRHLGGLGSPKKCPHCGAQLQKDKSDPSASPS